MTNFTVLCQLVMDNCLTTTSGLSQAVPLPPSFQTVNPISIRGADYTHPRFSDLASGLVCHFQVSSLTFSGAKSDNMMRTANFENCILCRLFGIFSLSSFGLCLWILDIFFWKIEEILLCFFCELWNLFGTTLTFLTSCSYIELFFPGLFGCRRAISYFSPFFD